MAPEPSPAGEVATSRRWLAARAWVPVCAIAALLLAPAGTTLRSTYAFRWYAVPLVLVAAIGRTHRAAALAAAVAAAAGAAYIAVDTVFRIAGGASPARATYVAGALIVIALSALQLERIVRRGAQIDPVVVAAAQLATGIAAQWVYYNASGLALDYRTYGRESLAALTGTELALVAIAFAAIGLGIARTWRPGFARLGLGPVTGWQVALALFVSQLLLLASYPVDLVTYVVAPGAFRDIEQILQHTFAGIPWWTFPLLAVLAGVGEETMFRGALQPRAGIVATAALFAMVHIQYGVTPVLLWLFVHGCIYGLLRRHANTTAAILAHGAYDLGAYLVLGPAMNLLLAILFALYLRGPGWRNRHAVWRTLADGFTSDWARLRFRLEHPLAAL